MKKRKRKRKGLDWMLVMTMSGDGGEAAVWLLSGSRGFGEQGAPRQKKKKLVALKYTSNFASTGLQICQMRYFEHSFFLFFLFFLLI